MKCYCFNWNSRWLLLLAVLLFSMAGHAQSGDSVNDEPEAEASSTVREIAGQLVTAKLKAVQGIVDELEQRSGEKVLPIFQGLLEGKLYYQKSDSSLVIVEKQPDARYQISDAISGQLIGVVEKKSLRKIRTNNRLRKNLRSSISRITLFSNDKALRKLAVSNILEDLSEENIQLLVEAQQQEQDPKILAAIDLCLSISRLNSEDNQARLLAVKSVSGSLEPLVRNELVKITEKNADGSYIESDARLVAAAEQGIKSIDGKIKLYSYLEIIFFGLSLGSVLLLAAAGLAITFGVMGVINMAHGEMIMLGAYTTYVVQLFMPEQVALSLLVAIPAAFAVSAIAGMIIERGVIQFLKGRPLETLLATFGISLILQQLVRSVFSPLNRQVNSPEFMSGAYEFNPVFSITYNRLYILIFALVVFAILQLVLKKTSLGLHVRAVSQNRDMAKCMGIKTEWVDAMTFGLGSGIAGLAGVALSQITNVGPNLGQAYIIDSFMVVVFGGAGNLWGTLVGGFSIGVLNKFLEPTTGAVLANIIILVGIILFIQKRPRGLFPQKGRAAE
jgi:urea transport system permease protein